MFAVEFILLFSSFSLLAIYAVTKDRKPATMPPGPGEVPFLGGGQVVTAAAALRLKKKYGSIVTQRVGKDRTVLVFDYADVKDLFSRPEFEARPEFFKRFNLDKDETVGVLFNYGKQWVVGRRFILRHLKDVGSGSSYLEGAVHAEAGALVGHLRNLKGSPTTFPCCFEVAVLNVIWQLVAGRRYDLDAEEVCKIFSLIEGVKKASALTVLLGIFPILDWLPSYVQTRLFKQHHLHKFLDHMRALSQRTIDEHLSSIDYDNPRDITDHFLKQMKEQTEQDPEKRFRIEGLHQLLFDLFNTGSDTVSNMLHWVVYYMARYPDMAQRCHDQINSVVNTKDILVSLEHRKHLPYVEAFTTEALRHSSMVVFMPQRCCTKDTFIKGYHLPKGTMITTCNYMVHRDPNFWSNPDQFLPERFLDAAGNFVAQKEAFMPFGIGRRQCAGEALARTEYFLFSAAILQNFSVTAAPGSTLIEEAHEYLGFRVPGRQLLVYKER